MSYHVGAAFVVLLNSNGTMKSYERISKTTPGTDSGHVLPLQVIFTSVICNLFLSIHVNIDTR